MAEPARQDDENEDRLLSAQERADRRWGLAKPDENTSDASKTDGDQPEKSAQERANERWGLADVKNAEEKGTSDPEQSDADQTESDQVGKGYNNDSPNKRRRKLFTPKRVIGGGIVSVIFGGGLGFLLFFGPLMRLESYFARINDRAFAFATNAVEQRVGYLFDRYLIKHVIDLDSCGNVVNNLCRDPIVGGGAAAGLYQAWRHARVEEKIFNELGFEIQSHHSFDKSAGAHRYTIKDQRGNAINITNGTLSDYNLTNERFTGGRREMARELRASYKKTTRWLQVLERRSIRKYGKEKHNMKFWCVFKCKEKDALEDKAVSAKTRLKYKFIERIAYPVSPKYGFIMECLTSGGDSCKAENVGETLRRRGLDRDAIPEGQITEIVGKFKKNPNAKLSQYVIEKLLEIVIKDAGVRTATLSSIPVAGQVYFALVWVDMFDRMDDFIENKGLSKMAADLNTRQYIEYYTMMRTVNDELKSGSLSFEEAGAVMGEFEGAEAGKLYQARYVSPATASLFGTKAFAQSTESTEDYRCPSGKPIPANELVCPEKKITRSFLIEDIRNNSIIQGIEPILNNYSPNNCGKFPPDACTVVRPTLGAIDKVFAIATGPLLKGAMATIEAGIKLVPRLDDLISFAKGKFTELYMAFFGKIWPSPVGIDSPGRDKRDALEAGAEVMAAEFAKGGYTEAGESYGLGAPVVSESEATTMLQEYFEQQEYEYKNLGTFAKLTDIEYPGSLMNQVIAGVPSRVDQVPSRIASGIPKIFSSIFNINIFSSFFGGNPAHAQVSGSAAANPFGITRFGYTRNHPAFTIDPELLTDEYCQNAKAAWLSSMKENKDTGIDEYYEANPCLLNEVAVEAAGGIFTGKYDLDDDTSAPATDPTRIPVGDLGKSSDHVQCAGGSKDIGTTRSQYTGDLKSQSDPIMLRLCQLTEIDGSGNNPTGGRITGGAVVNSLVSGAWQALGKQAKADGVPLTAYSSFRLADSCGGEGDGSACAEPGKSMHQLGIAIDFNGTHVEGKSTTSCSGRARDPGSKEWSWLLKNAERFGFKQYTFESWHWDAAPLANRCGSAQ